MSGRKGENLGHKIQTASLFRELIIISPPSCSDPIARDKVFSCEIDCETMPLSSGYAACVSRHSKRLSGIVERVGSALQGSLYNCVASQKRLLILERRFWRCPHRSGDLEKRTVYDLPS